MNQRWCKTTAVNSTPHRIASHRKTTTTQHKNNKTRVTITLFVCGAGHKLYQTDLRVLRKSNSALHTIRLHTQERLLCERWCISKGNVIIEPIVAWSCRTSAAQRIEFGNHCLALLVSPMSDRRTATNCFVLLFDFRSTPARHKRTNRLLKLS